MDPSPGSNPGLDPGPGPTPPAAAAPPSPTNYEQTHVHTVYETIAPHFSSTRHKPWPLVTAFLASLPPGSLVLDAGCGNGKYLLPDTPHHLLASDRSAALVELARGRARDAGAEVLVADSLALPFRGGCADAAICIAVVHHFSTPERRREAISELLGCVREGGEVLVYVWALEQRGSRRGWDEGGEQDLLVPWVMKGKAEGGGDETYQRYYHLYKEGELEGDVRAVGGKVLKGGYERDNWWVVCSR